MVASANQADIKDQLEDLRAALGDRVQLDEVADVVTTMLGGLSGDIIATDVQLQRELQDLVAFIRKAYNDICELKPREIHQTHIPTVADELDAIVASTEDAANKILEAAEQLENVAQTLDDKTSAKINDIVTGIYEASSFQDLTGQRITKVVGALHHIEQKVTELARAVGHDMPEESYLNVTDSVKALDEDDLLHGPSKLGETVDQNDVDALFG